jgi:Tfp pilus tip-associated adhesin PilY1
MHTIRKEHFQAMKPLFSALGLSLVFALGASLQARAEVTDISDVPLANSPSDAVRPNLMYILDDSGSMAWDYMPDNVFKTTTNYVANNCKTCSSSSCTINARQCASLSGNIADWGEPPYFSAQFNQIYYNPNITYNPALTSAGVSMGNVLPTAAYTDMFMNTKYANLITGSPAVAPDVYYCDTASPSSTRLTQSNHCTQVTNLTTAYPEIYYCNTSTPTTANLSDATVCKRNGINNVSGGYFLYYSNDTTSGGYPIRTGTTSTSFRNQNVQNTGHPYYFTITPHEYCSDTNLTLCQLANSDGTAPSGFTIPAPVRYCASSSDAASTSAISGNSSGSPRCRKKFDESSYQYPRYGRFIRTDIVSTTATYPKGTSAVRTDCASATSCTYAEELQNFANWWGYYRTRMQTMKTATGRAFLPIDDRYRVGFLTINPGSPVSSSKFLFLNTFDATQKSAWYTLLYGQDAPGSTPLRQALSRVGRYYGGVATGINSGMIDTTHPDPVQYSCQQNFALLTTDGYYNDNPSPSHPTSSDTSTLAGASVGNTDALEDLVDPIFVSRSSGTLDGQGSTSTVATTTSTTEQVICTANSSMSFSAATGGQANPSACGCSGTQKRVWQRVLVTTHQANLTEGTVTGTQPPDTYSNTFSPITACTTPLVVTTVTPMQQVEDAFCSGSGVATFTAQGGAPQACGCPAGQFRVLRRTGSFNNTTVTTDGTVTSNTNGAVTFGISPNPATATGCTAATTLVDQETDTQTEQAICTAGGTATFPGIGGSVACNAALNGGTTPVAGTKALVLATRVRTLQRTVTNGVAGAFGVTAANFTYTLVNPGFVQPQTQIKTFTVTKTQVKRCNNDVDVTFTIGNNANGSTTGGCNCSSSSKYNAWQRTATATYTVTFTDGVAGSPSALSSYTKQSDTRVLGSSSSNCTSTSTLASIQDTSPAFDSNGSTGVVTNNGSIAGTLLAITQSPNPSALVTSPITFASASPPLTITLSPNPGAVAPSGVAPSVSDNSGSGAATLTITLSPNPLVVGNPAVTTAFPGGTSDTLADVAMYYYKTDLRPCPGGTPASGVCVTDPKATNNVPNTSKDFAIHQHMTTFTLGLGLQGSMDYTSDYEVNTTSDLAKIKTASTNCAFSVGVCDWPPPVAGTATTLDDLWHAAVNGRGVYYSASDPNSLADGLSSALASLHIQTAAASASATSSPNITQTDNFIYSSTFRTVKWDGEVVAQQIDTSTGNVLPTIVWSAQTQLDALVTASADTRTIYAFKTGATNSLTPFLYANLLAAPSGAIAAEQPYFTNKCSALSQCSLLAIGDQATANAGASLVNYLRGQKQNENVFRARDHVLGDPVNATPAFVKAPVFNFNDAVTPTYATFKTANVNRGGVLFIAANDGMLHAFDGSTGAEKWAFVPRMVMPNMHHLATDNWDVNHTFLVDGSPQIMDVYDNRTDPAHPAWKTIIVGGLNKGGKGYYALDITDPNTPKGLWQTCSDNTLCENSDVDFGYSFGNPVITKRASDGRWVVLVTSGLDNVQTGATGRGFLYVLDAFTGAILRKVDTTVGDTTTPSGFNKISAFANDFNTNNTALYVYGGDLLGNVWRFDMSADPPTALKLATLKDGSGKPQSITSRPELGVISGNRVVFIGTGRYLGANDLFDPSTLSPTEQWAYQQSIYALKDKGTAYGDPRSATPGLVAQTITDSGGTTRTTSSNLVNWTTKDGWYTDLNPGGSSPGERINLDMQLVQGTLVAVSNVPNNSACTVGGDSFTYQFDYTTGKAVSSSANGVVGAKTVGQITVGVVVFRRPSGVFTGVGTGATGIKTPFGINIGGGGGSGRRVSWRELVR